MAERCEMGSDSLIVLAMATTRARRQPRAFELFTAFFLPQIAYLQDVGIGTHCFYPQSPCYLL
jgi:hypothetical protein